MKPNIQPNPEQLAQAKAQAKDLNNLDEMGEWLDDHIKTIDSTGFRIISKPGYPFRWIKPDPIKNSKLTVILSGHTYPDSKRWVHVSFSRPNRFPDYTDVCLVKNAFIGKNKKAIQVHPSEDEHINAHGTCLHLWHCIDGDTIPDFRINGTI